MASVALRNVWKYYGHVEAVIDNSWKCEDREFFSILGPSGCGKSSTLRMVAGLEEISKGDLFFDSRRVNDLHPRDRNVAMVFENWALYPTMNVYDNIAHPLRVRRIPAREIDQKVREAAEFLGLTEILKHNVKRLSGGEMQRVSIGRAIVRDPAVLLMDEPISHLDASLRSRMRDELKTQISKLGVTTLYITHDQVEAMAMADRIAVMNEGRVQQIGKPLDIYSHPRNIFVAGFIGGRFGSAEVPFLHDCPGGKLRQEYFPLQGGQESETRCAARGREGRHEGRAGQLPRRSGLRRAAGRPYDSVPETCRRGNDFGAEPRSFPSAGRSECSSGF